MCCHAKFRRKKSSVASLHSVTRGRRARGTAGFGSLIKKNIIAIVLCYSVCALAGNASPPRFRSKKPFSGALARSACQNFKVFKVKSLMRRNMDKYSTKATRKKKSSCVVDPRGALNLSPPKKILKKTRGPPKNSAPFILPLSLTRSTPRPFFLHLKADRVKGVVACYSIT